MADFTFAACNLHNNPAAVDWLRRRSRRDARDHFDLAAVYEAHRRRRRLRGLPGHDYHTGKQPGPSQETGILLANDLPYLGHGAQFVSREAEQFESVGKERWGQVVTTRIENAVVDGISLHPVAGPQALAGSNPDHPLVKRYAKAMRWLEATIVHSEALGHEWVLGMDAQMFPGQERPWSPHAIFAEHKAWTVWERIDLVAGSSGLVPVGNKAARVRHDFPSDHPALVVDINVNRTKQRK